MPANTEQKYPRSYGQRLGDHFEESGSTDFSLDEVRGLIKAFGKIEFEKRKQNADVLSFGKFKGKTVKLVAQFDRQYLVWLVKQPMMSNYSALKAEIEKELA
jgi:hypothetical protein